MDFIIKELTEDLINESFFETNSNLRDIDKSIEETKALFKKQKSNKDYIRLVAVEGKDNIIGSIVCLLEQKLIMGHAIRGHLEDVVTRKGYEGMGVGKSLVNEVSKIAKERGCKKIVLSCQNDKIVFYEKCGYSLQSNSMKIIIE